MANKLQQRLATASFRKRKKAAGFVERNIILLMLRGFLPKAITESDYI